MKWELERLDAHTLGNTDDRRWPVHAGRRHAEKRVHHLSAVGRTLKIIVGRRRYGSPLLPSQRVDRHTLGSFVDFLIVV